MPGRNFPRELADILSTEVPDPVSIIALISTILEDEDLGPKFAKLIADWNLIYDQGALDGNPK